MNFRKLLVLYSKLYFIKYSKDSDMLYKKFIILVQEIYSEMRQKRMHENNLFEKYVIFQYNN